MPDNQPTRKLSLHERFSVARRNAGFPHAVTVLIAYPSPSALPQLDQLSTRIDELQSHFPLLNCNLRDRKTREPYFEQRGDHWPVETILQNRDYTTLSSSRDEKEAVLFTELTRVQSMDVDISPLWQISLYTAGPLHPAYLTLSVDHALVDGKGDILLLKALLSPDISSLPYEKTADIALLEATLPVIPGFRQIIGVVWSELVVPKLPSLIGNYFKPLPYWPASLPPLPAVNCSPSISLLELPSSLTSALKATGRNHGVTSLHPVLKISHAVAIWAVVGHTLQPFAMRLNTPGSVRDTSLKHSYCTGNYTSSYDYSLTATSDTDFWNVTTAAAQYLRSPTGKARALHAMGMLAYIPDPTPDPSRRDTARPTGWEDFFMNKALGPNPAIGSGNLSNLGHVDLPPGATDVIWGQGASPFAPPFSLNVIGNDQGLRCTTVWREGSALTRDVVKQAEEVWVKVLSRLADEGWKGATFGDLVAE